MFAPPNLLNYQQMQRKRNQAPTSRQRGLQHTKPKHQPVGGTPMSDQINTTSVRQQCRHIFTGGHRYGSPCLRREDFCYCHHTPRKPAPRRPRESPGFAIAAPEDRSAIQHTIGEVLAASPPSSSTRAGLLLYGLQIASGNLPRRAALKTPPQPGNIVEDISEDPELGPLAPPAEFRKANASSTSRRSSCASGPSTRKTRKPNSSAKPRPEVQT